MDAMPEFKILSIWLENNFITITYEYDEKQQTIKFPYEKDVVEVVRCGNCEYWDERYCRSKYGWCNQLSGYRHEGWFCGDGKSKV